MFLWHWAACLTISNFAGRGLSAAQIVAETCLGSHSHLHGERQRLFTSLFVEGSHQLYIVRKLAIRQEGLTREEVAEACAISAGGQLSLWLSELIEAALASVAASARTTSCRLKD